MAAVPWKTRLLTTIISFLPSYANIVAMTKQPFRSAIKTVAGIAAVVFFLARFTTSTGVLWFVGSIIVIQPDAVTDAAA